MEKAPLDNGPPFWYYENVAHPPRRVWMTISRSLYDIQPEFVRYCILIISVQQKGKKATSIICQLRTDHLFFIVLQRPYLRHSLITRCGGLPGTQECSSTSCKQVWQVQS